MSFKFIPRRQKSYVLHIWANEYLDIEKLINNRYIISERFSIVWILSTEIENETVIVCKWTRPEQIEIDSFVEELLNRNDVIKVEKLLIRED